MERFLNMPLFIEDDYVRASMRQDKNNQKILNQGMFADMVLTSINDLESVKELVTDKTCAIILEPVQGEGGINVATEEF